MTERDMPILAGDNANIVSSIGLLLEGRPAANGVNRKHIHNLVIQRRITDDISPTNYFLRRRDDVRGVDIL